MDVAGGPHRAQVGGIALTTDASIPDLIAALDTQAFAERGLIKVAGLIPKELAAAAKTHLDDRISRVDLPIGEWWAALQVDQGFRKRRKAALKGCSASASFRALLTDEVLAVTRHLLGGDEVKAMPPHRQLLLTPPNANEWTVPHNNWHLDYPRSGDVGWAGVQVFTFLSPVTAGGGGTLELAGSHRLLNDAGVLDSKKFRRRLKREEYFRALTDENDLNRRRFMDEIGHICGVPVKVVELTGDPGDVYFVDLRLLHSIGPNTSQALRMMVTQRLLRASVAAQITVLRQHSPCSETG